MTTPTNPNEIGSKSVDGIEQRARELSSSIGHIADDWRKAAHAHAEVGYACCADVGRRCADELEDALRSAEQPSTPEESSVVRQPMDGCGACGDACASNGGTCRVRAENPPAEQPSATEPPVDEDAMRRMNSALCEFALRWRLDGDYIRCTACERPQLAGYASLDFPHAAGCPALEKAEPKPWQTLVVLLSPLYSAPPAPRNDDAPRESLGRFGHHPDPATDFEIEVDSLTGRLFNSRHGIPNEHGAVETAAQISHAVDKAMAFRVGGCESAVAAKAILRALSLEIAQSTAPREAAQDEVIAECVGAVRDDNEYGNVVHRLTEGGIDAIEPGDSLYIINAPVPPNGALTLYTHPAPQQREGASELTAWAELCHEPTTNHRYWKHSAYTNDLPVGRYYFAAPLRPVTDEMVRQVVDAYVFGGEDSFGCVRAVLESFLSRLAGESAT